MASDRELSVSEAKANFAAAMDELHPLRIIKERPLAATALTVLSGAVISYAGLKVLKRVLIAPKITLAILKKIL